MKKQYKNGIIESGIDREGQPYTITKFSSKCYQLKTPNFSYSTSSFEDAKRFV